MSADRDAPNDRLLEQATDWFYRIAGAPDDAHLRRELETWLAADQAHAKAWALTQRAWDLSGEVRRPEAPQGPSRIGRRAAAGVAAMALAACLALFIVAPEVRLRFAADYRTGTGETASIALADGSVVDLGADSAIETRITVARRDIVLLRGQAFFRVEQDRNRPFNVDAGGYAVRVTGTAFDVGLTDRRLAVAVSHGSVRVGGGNTETVDLVRGDRIAIDRRNGGTLRTRIADKEVAAWRDGQLVVHGRAFADVVDVIRRYYPGLIVVAMEGVADRQVTGVYDLADPIRALRALSGPFGGVVRTAGPFVATVSAF